MQGTNLHGCIKRPTGRRRFGVVQSTGFYINAVLMPVSDLEAVLL